jgi:WD40 repeat protein
MLPSKSRSPSRLRSRQGASVPEMFLVLALIASAVGTIGYWHHSILQRNAPTAGASTEIGPNVPLHSVAITPDRKHIYTTGLDGKVRTYSLATQELLNELPLEYGYSRCLICSPTGRQIIVGTVTGQLLMWDFGSSVSKPRTVKGHESEVLCGAFRPEGNFFVTSDKNGNCSAWSSRDLAPIWTMKNQTGTVTALTFSNDGRRLISGDMDGYLKTWDPTTGKLLSTCRVDNSQFDMLRRIVAVDDIPDSEDVVVLAATGPIQRWNVSLGQCKRLFENQPSSNRCLALSPDGKTLASGATDGSISVWDVGSAVRLKTWSAHASGVSNLWFAADGSRFASVGWDGVMNVWPL